MGFAKFIQGAPERDPQFILPPENEEVYDEHSLLEADRRNGCMLKFALGAAGVVVIGTGVMVAATMDGHHPRTHANAQQSPTESTSTLEPSASPSPSESPSPTPSPSLMPKAEVSPTRVLAQSPSHIPSPSVTASRKVTFSPTPSPTPKVSTPTAEARCKRNENAPGEVVCTSPVNAYTDARGDEVAFEITGGTAPNCENIQAGRVEVAIGNAIGWASLVELGNPC